MGADLYLLRRMKLFTLVFVSAVCAREPFNGPQRDEKGIYLDTRMMTAMCTYNTEIGDKMEKAHKDCNLGAEEETVNRRQENGQGQGNGQGNCEVDFDNVAEFFDRVWEKKACVLREVGWVEEGDAVNGTNMMNDIATLPPALAAGLVDTRDLCINRSMEATLENLFTSEEFGATANLNNQNNSTDEECRINPDPQTLLDIEITLQKLAFFRCVHENFLEGCGNYVLGAVNEMLMEMSGQAQSTMIMP